MALSPHVSCVSIEDAERLRRAEKVVWLVVLLPACRVLIRGLVQRRERGARRRPQLLRGNIVLRESAIQLVAPLVQGALIISRQSVVGGCRTAKVVFDIRPRDAAHLLVGLGLRVGGKRREVEVARDTARRRLVLTAENLARAFTPTGCNI